MHLGDWLPPRSADTARPYTVYSDIGDLSDEFQARLFVLAARVSDVAAGIPLAFEETDDAPTVATKLVEIVEGRSEPVDRFGRPNPEQGQHLREQLATARRQLGRTARIAFAVKYGRKVKRVTRPVEFPTAEMLASLGDSVVMGGRRWNITQDENALPAGPGRAALAIVAFDSRGRLHDCLPQPSLAELDTWGGRNLRALARAAFQHPDRTMLDAFCARHGLEPFYAWREIDRPARAA